MLNMNKRGIMDVNGNLRNLSKTSSINYARTCVQVARMHCCFMFTCMKASVAVLGQKR
jgi:hypothetical protein